MLAEMTMGIRSVGQPTGSALQPAAHRLAIDALALGVGAKLPTNAQYLSEHQMGAGTLQRALRVLEDRGALRTTSHGHQGRTIQAIDVGAAWQTAALSPVRLLLPPRGPIEIDQLQEFLADELTALGIPHTVHHLPGGARRLGLVLAGLHDIALTSSGVRDDDHSHDPKGSATLTRRLEPGTYYARGRVVVVRRAGEGNCSRLTKIAIDPDSPDHKALTLAEFPECKGIAHITMPFPQVPAAVLRREVDAGVWHVHETVIPLDLAGLQLQPLSRSQSLDVWRQISAAVLYAWPGRPELAAVLASLHLDKLPGTQLKGRMETAD